MICNVHWVILTELLAPKINPEIKFRDGPQFSKHMGICKNGPVLERNRYYVETKNDRQLKFLVKIQESFLNL